MYLCNYEVMGASNAPETGVSSSFELTPDKDITIPIVKLLKESFPYEGVFHFRAKVRLGESRESYGWLDLDDPDAPVPVWDEEGGVNHIYIRVLPLYLGENSATDGTETVAEDLDWSGKDLEEDISTHQSSSWSREDDIASQRYRQHTRSNSGSSWSQHIKEATETVLTSDVARDLTKKSIQVGKQVGKQMGKLFSNVMKAVGTTETGGTADDYSLVVSYPSSSTRDYLMRMSHYLKSAITPMDVERLFQVLFPNYREGCGQAPSSLWRSAGFSNPEDLKSDFRGTGSLCLQCMLYFGGQYPGKMQGILRRKDVAQRELAYPLVVAANNLTLMIIDVLKLREGRFSSSQTVFWAMFSGPPALEEVFTHSLVYLERRWNELEASLDHLPQLIQQTRGQLEIVLGQGPSSIVHFKELTEKSSFYID